MRKCIPLLIVFYLSPYLFGNNDVSMSIRFFDKSLYYTDSSIQVKVEIKNEGIRPYQFKVADFKQYNLLFRVSDMRNRELPHSQRYRAFFQSSNPYFYRDVDLQPGEEFAFVVELEDFVDIEEPGEFLVEARFFPFLKSILDEGEDPLLSNRLLLSVRPSAGSNPVMDQIEEESQMVLRAEEKSPDEVISYTLGARQKDQWVQFFLYIDLPSLLKSNPPWERMFRQSSEEERLALISTFKENLMKGELEEYRSFMERPDRFEVLHTSYSPDYATVKVREYFSSDLRDFIITRDYTYHLSKLKGIWKITYYEVSNIRTE